MAHDVFISYSSKDKAIADAVCARLEEKRLRVWIAPRDVPPGSDFAESIIDAIDASKVFVLIWSADANASAHILNEVNEAFNKGIVIIPFRIQDVQPTRSFQYYIGRTHWLDALTQPLEQHIEKLAATITAVLRHGPGADIPTATWQAQIGKLEPTGGLPQVDENYPIDNGHPKPADVSVKPAFKPAHILLFAGAIIGLGLGAVLLYNSLKPADKPVLEESPTQVVVPTQAAILSRPANPISPTSIIVPTADPTTVYEDAFSSGILAKINTYPPAFEDDFWEENIAWDYLHFLNADLCDPQNSEMTVEGGSLMVTLKPGCRVLHLYHPDVEFTNYVMQVQFKLQDQALFLFDADFLDAVDTGGGRFGAMFSVSNNGYRLDKPKYLGMLVESELIASGPLQNNPQQPFTFTLIKSGAEHYYYINTKLLTSYVEQDSNYTGRSQFRLGPGIEEDPIEPVSIEILGVKVWDLDTIPSAEPTGVQEDAFSSGILAKINTSPPAFEDDIWDENTAWDYLHFLNADLCDPQQAEMTAKNGSLIVTLKPGCSCLHLYHPDLVFTNYVMQVQLKLQDQAGFGFDAEFPDAVDTGGTFNLLFHISNDWWSLEQPKYLGMLAEFESIASGPLQNSPQQPFTLTAIKSGAEHYYYMNTTLLARHTVTNTSFTGRSQFRLTPTMPEINEPLSIEILGVKVWDLDAIQ